MLLMFLFGLKTNSPSTIEVSVTSDGSRQGAKSARLTYSPLRACWITLVDTFAPEGRHVCVSVVPAVAPLDSIE
jgi:hypothetical protein